MRLLDLNILLEFGVAQTTQISLIELGLTRSSAIVPSELISADSLSPDECLNWLRDNDWMTEALPAVAKQEIALLQDRKTATT